MGNVRFTDIQTNRLRRAGIRDLVIEICCVLHNFPVRLMPWRPMV
jgi:hypothetical protein